MIEFLQTHAFTLGAFAPWVFFTMLLLAGLNIPFSADMIIFFSALCAATMPSKLPHFYLGCLLGCVFSAWIAYSLGRWVGPKLRKIKWFATVLTEKRITKLKKFYERRGFLTLLIGRFIPFGVRNCLFMSSGMTKVNFFHFAIKDLIACFIWCTSLFSLFYFLSDKGPLVLQQMKKFQVILFSAFSVTVIALVWYKKRKKNFSDIGT